MGPGNAPDGLREAQNGARRRPRTEFGNNFGRFLARKWYPGVEAVPKGALDWTHRTIEKSDPALSRSGGSILVLQFLASRNAMAALIGGKTPHHWDQTPLNLEQRCLTVRSRAALP